MPRRPRLADMVADAVLVAGAAVRQSVKNAMLVRALRDSADFDHAWYLAAVRGELESLAAEAEADAERIGNEAARAAHRGGVAQHAADYRAGDRTALRRRRRTLLGLAEQLRALATDNAYIEDVLSSARSRALDEITNTAASVPGAGTTEASSGVERSLALQRLRDELSDYAD